MVQCYACEVWFHYQCIGEKDSDIVGIWSCQSCRSLAKTINVLMEKLASIDSTVRLLQENNTHLTRIILEQSKASEEVQEENRTLRGEIAELRAQIREANKRDTVLTQLDRLSAQLVQLNGGKLPGTADLERVETEKAESTLLLTWLSDGFPNGGLPLITANGRTVQQKVQARGNCPQAWTTESCFAT